MNKALSIIGSSRLNGERDMYDFYPTPGYVVEELLKREKFSTNIWEPACGKGDISEVLENHGHLVTSTDLMDRGYRGQFVCMDFLNSEPFDGDIITNPPFKCALEFVNQAKMNSSNKIAFFLRTLFLESEKRKKMFEDQEFPLKAVYQFSKRVTLYKGDVKMKNSGMIAYAWFVWDRNWKSEPIIRWI